MKRAAAVLALLGLASWAGASTITVKNIGSPANTSTLLVNGLGNAQIAVGSGTVAIGSFKVGNDALKALPATNVSGILAQFNQLGDAFKTGFGANGGLYQNTVTGAINAGDAWAGKNVYTVIGNGATLASSASLFVFQHAIQFKADPDATDDALLQRGKGDVIIGSGDQGAVSFAGNAQYANVFRVGIIPEPSSALLLLSGLAVAFRRRK